MSDLDTPKPATWVPVEDTPLGDEQEPTAAEHAGEDHDAVLGVAPGGAGLGRRPILLWLAIGWLVLIAVLAFGADVLPLRDPGEIPSDAKAMLDHPTSQAPGFRADFLGTDDLGRSALSRVIFGARVSLGVGLVAAVLAMAVGVVIGVVAGYYRGPIDYVVDLLLNTLLSFPALVLLIGLSLVFTPSRMSITLELAVLATPTFARIARANTLALRNREFVLAAQVMGAGGGRILGRELMPAVVRSLLSYLFIVSSTLMVAEAGLSFLGLGVPSPTPTWGGMIAGGLQRVQQDPGLWFLVFVPAGVFFLTIFSLNVFGDWLRQRMGRRVSL